MAVIHCGQEPGECGSFADSGEVKDIFFTTSTGNPVLLGARGVTGICYTVYDPAAGRYVGSLNGTVWHLYPFHIEAKGRVEFRLRTLFRVQVGTPALVVGGLPVLLVALAVQSMRMATLAVVRCIGGIDGTDLALLMNTMGIPQLDKIPLSALMLVKLPLDNLSLSGRERLVVVVEATSRRLTAMQSNVLFILLRRCLSAHLR